MKKIALSFIAASFSMSFASYQVVFPNQQVNFKNIPSETFTPTDPLVSNWANVGSLYDCSNYTPEASDVDIGVIFTQTTDNCKIDQERTIQQRQLSSITHAVSNVGEAIVERQVVTNQSNSRNATGTRPETFTPTDPLISEWSNVADPYGCTNYSPSVADTSYAVKFTQTATDCKVDQERTVQNRQISSITQAVSNVGEPITEKQTLKDQSSNREATGTRYNYILYVGSYVAWGTPSYGYFSQSYMNTYQGSVSMSVSGSMSSYSFRGSSIDHLVEQNGNITLRLLPSVTGNAPSLTINGVTCTLNGPTVYSAYDGYNCNMRLINNVGKNLYIDLR